MIDNRVPEIGQDRRQDPGPPGQSAFPKSQEGTKIGAMDLGIKTVGRHDFGVLVIETDVI